MEKPKDLCLLTKIWGKVLVKYHHKFQQYDAVFDIESNPNQTYSLVVTKSF